MLKIYRHLSWSSRLRKKWNYFHKNGNTILHTNLRLNEVLNYFAFPFVFRWKQNLETFIISRKFKNIYWLVLIFKFVHVMFLTRLALYGPLNPAIKLPLIAPAIFCINIAALAATTLADVVAIRFARDIVNSFSWAYQIASDFLSNLKFRTLSN